MNSLFINILSQKIDSIHNYTNHDIFILGDININFLQNSSPGVKEAKALANTYGMLPLIKEPTRITENNNSAIDQIFTNSNNVYNAGVLDLNLSDHLPVFVTRKKLTLKQEKTSFLGRLYKDYNKRVFQNELKNTSWEDFERSDSSEEAWNILKSKIEDVINLMCPIKNIRIKKFKEEWVTQELLGQIKLKDYLLQKAKKSNKPEDWIRARMLRNETKQWIKNAKAEYVQNQLQDNISDSKFFLRNI